MVPPFGKGQPLELKDAQDLPAAGDLEKEPAVPLGPGVIGVEGHDPVLGRVFGRRPLREGPDGMVRDLLRRKKDAEDLEKVVPGLLLGLSPRQGPEEMADPAVVGDLLPQRRHPVLEPLPLFLRLPGMQGPDEAHPEVAQPREINFGGQAQEPGERPEVVLDLGVHARVEENDPFRGFPEELLGLLPVRGPEPPDMVLPALQPSGEEQEGLALEEAVQDVLVRDPLEALALLVDLAGVFETRLSHRLGKAKAPDEQNRMSVRRVGADRFVEAIPPGFGLIAFHLKGQEIDLPELGEPGQGPRLALEVGTDDQAKPMSHVTPFARGSFRSFSFR